MITALLSFFTGLGTSFYKYLALAALFIALLVGTYSKGHADGMSSSAELAAEAYSKGVAAQQPTIDKLTKQINDEHSTVNTKVTTLEKQASASADEINKLNLLLKAKTTKVVTNYIHDNPVLINRIGYSLPTVQAINLVLDADIKFDANGEPLPDKEEPKQPEHNEELK